MDYCKARANAPTCMAKLKRDCSKKGVFKQGKISHQFPQRIGSKIYYDYMEGEFQEEGLLHGSGNSINQERFRAGNFVNGKLHGKGKLVFEDGMAWEGIFVNGKFTGEGSVSFPATQKQRRRPSSIRRYLKSCCSHFEFMLFPDKDLTDIPNSEQLTKSLSPEQAFYVHQTIKGFAKLNENLDEFKKFLREEGIPEIFRAKNIPEFAFHKENGSSTLISNISYTLQIFAEQYAHHTAQESVPTFLKEAFDPEQASSKPAVNIC